MLGIGLHKQIANQRRKVPFTTAYASGGTFSNNDTVGDIDWVSPSNAATSNDVYATIQNDETATSKYLLATNFGLSIPTDAVIRGILVEVERSQTVDGPPNVTDNSIRLFKAGVVTGANKSTGAQWLDNDSYIAFGGATDLWGTTWTATEINNIGFGVGISAIVQGAALVKIDHIRIKIYYEA